MDARIAALGTLTDEKLALHVAIASDSPDWSVDLRTSALLRTVGEFIDLHAWSLSWDERGMRLSHGTRSVVPGAPASFRHSCRACAELVAGGSFIAARGCAAAGRGAVPAVATCGLCSGSQMGRV